MPKSPLPLRFSPSGPKIGVPPLLATPDIMSLILVALGDSSLTDFDAATEPVMFNGGSTDLPVDLKVGYRYSIFAQFSVEQTGLTVSHLFTPRWNRRITSTGAWLASDATAPTFQTNQVLASPADASETNSLVACCDEFIPTVAYDQVRLAMTSISGILASASIRNPNCWIAIVERAGIAP
jgi:hypothetical protein